MSELLAQALQITRDGSWHELARVGKIVRESGDAESLRLLEQAAESAGNSRECEAWQKLERIAADAGCTGFDVLNLVTEVSNPDAHAYLRQWQAEHPQGARWDDDDE